MNGSPSIATGSTGVLGRLLRRPTQSASLMTWGALATKVLSLAVVLPLVLVRFPSGDAALWLILTTIMSFQMLFDIGFAPTFARLIAYGRGGASVGELKDFRSNPDRRGDAPPNWQTIERIVSTMGKTYSMLALLSFTFLAVFGTWALNKPVSASSQTDVAWLAWLIVLTTTTLSVRGNAYSAYLQGINQISLLRRWEILMSLGSIFTSVIVLLLDGGLSTLVAANQAWVVATIVNNRRLCIHIEHGRFREFAKKRADKDVLLVVWPAAWRSGIGIFMSNGLIHASGIAYSQVASPTEAGSYLLALRLIQTVSLFSQAPYYTKLPELARLRAQGRLKEQVELAKRGMVLAYISYAVGFALIASLAPAALKFIGSSVNVPNHLLLSLLGLSFLIERYGAMHIQLYSTTNHIVWHVANGVTGAICVAACLLLFPLLSVYAFPVAMLVGYLGFYSWYSGARSYATFDLKFWAFEKHLMIPFLLAAVFYVIVVWLFIEPGVWVANN